MPACALVLAFAAGAAAQNVYYDQAFARAQADAYSLDSSLVAKEGEGMDQRPTAAGFVGEQVDIGAKPAGAHGRKVRRDRHDTSRLRIHV